jgi:hypothetical protein
VSKSRALTVLRDRWSPRYLLLDGQETFSNNRTELQNEDRMVSSEWETDSVIGTSWILEPKVVGNSHAQTSCRESEAQAGALTPGLPYERPVHFSEVHRRKRFRTCMVQIRVEDILKFSGSHHLLDNFASNVTTKSVVRRSIVS